jgi:hypothetical protein
MNITWNMKRMSMKVNDMTPLMSWNTRPYVLPSVREQWDIKLSVHGLWRP